MESDIKCWSFVSLPAAGTKPEHAVRKAEFDALAAAVAEQTIQFNVRIIIEYSDDNGNSWMQVDSIYTSIPGAYRVTIVINENIMYFTVVVE